MSDTAMNGESAPVAAEVAPAPLKSTDTRKAPDARAPSRKPEGEPAKPAPVEKPTKPAPAVADATPVDGAEPPEGDDAAAAVAPSQRKEQRLPRWMQERLQRERQVTAARTREEVLRELQQQGQVPAAAPQRQAEAEAPTEKTLADFDFDPVAYQKYLAKQAVEDYKREERERAEQTEHAAAAEKFKAKIDAFEVKVGAGAWDDIESSPLNADPKFKPLVDLFLGDDNDLEIAHHLATHLDEAARLLALPPLQRVREVAKLADTFSDPPEVDEKPAPAVPPKKLTNAPPPPKTVSGAGKPSVDVRNPEISTADRIKAWKARGQ